LQEFTLARIAAARQSFGDEIEIPFGVMSDERPARQRAQRDDQRDDHRFIHTARTAAGQS
jgi:hypothetical protein